MKFMKATLALTLLILSLTPSLTASGQENLVGQYRGYDEISRIVAHRLIETKKSFRLGDYLGSPRREFIPGLSAMMGVWDGTGMHQTFRNGKANPLNLTLYFLLFTRIGQHVAADACAGRSPFVMPYGEPKFDFKPRLLEAASQLCQWPTDGQALKTHLHRLWDILLVWDAPLAERDALVEFYEPRDPKPDEPGEVLAEAIRNMLMNPYFLLRS